MIVNEEREKYMTIIEINSEKEFLKVIVENKLVVADFWAEWCGPCRVQSPILDKLAAKYPNDVVVAKINVDNNEILARNYKITSIPTLLIFSKGTQYGAPIIGVTGLERLENVVFNLKAK